MTDPIMEPVELAPGAREAAFALVFPAVNGAPIAFERHDDATLADRIYASGSRDERLAAVAAVRALCDAAYDVAEWVRSGHLGDPPSYALALRWFASLAPGFTRAHNDAARVAGLMWTR